MRDGTILRKRHGEEGFLRGTDCLIDSERRISALADTHAYAALLVADNDGNAEREAATAGHDAGHAAHIERCLLEFAAFARRALARTAARATTTVIPTTAANSTACIC